MAEYFFALSPSDQREALLAGGAATGRPPYLLEKDIWVVWTLRALYESELGKVLTFKGGTSLSKAYGVINRFSEDIDLTYNIRHLLKDLLGESDLPSSRSQKGRWTRTARERLPEWIGNQAKPVIQKRLDEDKLTATLTLGGSENDSLLLSYSSRVSGTAYVKPTVTMEFGGRATGEPHAAMPVQTDLEGQIPGVFFPTANPVVMSIARTFWEKATAAHVYCLQRRIRGERYARHWHDLAAIAASSHFPSILMDRAVARMVAEHKEWFFPEKDASGGAIEYHAAVQGRLQLAPEGDALQALAQDYIAMTDAGLLLDGAMEFGALMQRCAKLQTQINEAMATAPDAGATSGSEPD